MRTNESTLWLHMTVHPVRLMAFICLVLASVAAALLLSLVLCYDRAPAPALAPARTLVVLASYSRHTLVVLSSYSRRTLVVLSSYSRRTLVVLLLNSCRIIVVLLSCLFGTLSYECVVVEAVVRCAEQGQLC